MTKLSKINTWIAEKRYLFWLAILPLLATIGILKGGFMPPALNETAELIQNAMPTALMVITCISLLISVYGFVINSRT